MCGGRHRREDRNGARLNGWPRFPKFWQSRLRLLGDDKDDEKLSRTPNLPFSDTAAAHHSAHSAPDRQKKIQVPRFDVRVVTVARDYGCLQVVYRKDSAGRLPRPGETTDMISRQDRGRRSMGTLSLGEQPLQHDKSISLEGKYEGK